MKRLLWLGAALLLLGSATAQQAVEDYLAQVRIRVTDDSGAPVARAEVALSTFSNWVPGRKAMGRDEYSTIVGATDTNGMTVLKLKGSTGRYGCMVLPLPGYQFDKGTEYVFTNSATGRWEPWSPLVPLVLKRRSATSLPAPASEPGKAATSAPGVSKDPQVGRQELFPQERR
jgi:hypothetical protein